MSRSLVNNCQRISRRTALTGTAALSAAALAAAIPQASARQKISQADAEYQGTPKGDQRCNGCISFQPPNAFATSKEPERRGLLHGA
jgi:hypothetical protein